MVPRMRFTLFFALSLLAVACTHAPPTEGTGGQSTASAAGPSAPVTPATMTSRTKGTVIAVLETRDRKVSVLGTGGDVRIVVRQGDGAILADGITVDELRTLDPALHELMSTAVAGAGDGSTPRTFLLAM
jgi:hypothetical protein